MVGGAKNFSMWFGLALMFVTIILGARIERNKKDPSSVNYGID